MRKKLSLSPDAVSRNKSVILSCDPDVIPCLVVRSFQLVTDIDEVRVPEQRP